MANKFIDSNGVSHMLLKLKTVIPDWIKDTFALKTELPTEAEKTNWTAGYSHSTSAHAPTNAQKNVQSDWSVTDATSDAYIKNKPTKISEFTNDKGFITQSDVHTHSNKTVLDEISDEKVTAWDAAEKNVIVAVSLNGAALTPDSNRKVNVTVPTKVSELMNDKTYMTQSEVADAITAEVGKITGFEFVICASGEYDETTLSPTITGGKGKVYLVPKTDSEEDNVYAEFIWVNGNFEKIGDTTVDLSGYMKTTDMVALTNDEIDSIVAAT